VKKRGAFLQLALALAAGFVLSLGSGSSAEEREGKPEFEIPEVLIVDEDESEAFFRGRLAPGLAPGSVGLAFPRSVIGLDLRSWPVLGRREFVKPGRAARRSLPLSGLDIHYGSFGSGMLALSMFRPGRGASVAMSGEVYQSSGHLPEAPWKGARVRMSVAGPLSERVLFRVSAEGKGKIVGVPYLRGERRKGYGRLSAAIAAVDVSSRRRLGFSALVGKNGGGYGQATAWREILVSGTIQRWGRTWWGSPFVELAAGEQGYSNTGAAGGGSRFLGKLSGGSVWKLSRRTWIRLGTRYDSFGRTEQLSLEAELKHVLPNGVVVAVGLEPEFDVPDPSVLYTETDLVEVEPALDPVRAPWGVVARVEKRELAGGNRLKLEAFHRRVTGLYSWEDLAGDGLWRPSNLGERSLSGLTAVLDRRWGARFGWAVEYSFRKWVGGEVSYLPRHLLRMTVRVGWPVEISGWLDLSSERSATAGGSRRRVDLSSYATLGVRLSKSWQGWTAGVEGWNLTDVDYEYFPGIGQPPRHFGATLRKSF